MKTHSSSLQLNNSDPGFHFHANPMPNFEHPFALKPTNITLTNPKPFSLKTEERGEFAQRTLQEKLEREQREMEEARNFKAQPVTYFRTPNTEVF